MNYEDLTKELSNLFMDLKAGKVEPALAHELNVTALNIQGTIRLGLLNAKLQNKAPDLAFFKEARQKVTAKKVVRK